MTIAPARYSLLTLLFLALILNTSPSGRAQVPVNPQVLQLMNQANDLAAKEDFKGAIAVYQQALTITPEDPSLYANMAGLQPIWAITREQPRTMTRQAQFWSGIRPRSYPGNRC